MLPTSREAIGRDRAALRSKLHVLVDSKSEVYTKEAIVHIFDVACCSVDRDYKEGLGEPL